jgi:hypothetical protein
VNLPRLQYKSGRWLCGSQDLKAAAHREDENQREPVDGQVRIAKDEAKRRPSCSSPVGLPLQFTASDVSGENCDDGSDEWAQDPRNDAHHAAGNRQSARPALNDDLSFVRRGLIGRQLHSAESMP